MEGMPLIAVSLPPNSQLQRALAYIDEEADLGTVALEESAVRYR